MSENDFIGVGDGFGEIVGDGVAVDIGVGVIVGVGDGVGVCMVIKLVDVTTLLI